MFSIPLNQKLSEKQFYEFMDFCKEYKDYIYDIYFTSRMPPFTQDAMGDIIILQEDQYFAIETALHIQKTLGIRVSATFNNIKVAPTQQNLDLFIKNFKPIYDAGVRSATIPHTHWVSTGQIQAAFPELFIKNTILRNVSRPNEIAKLAEAGFHYINLDRDMMRDRDGLIACKRAADKYKVKLSLLGNEGCLGNCPMMDEHFEYNNSRAGETPAYFHDSISRVSCPKWNVEDPSVPLKTANLPPWKEDWDEMKQFVDVFKMHGRESVNQLYMTMDIIKRYAKGEEILFDDFETFINENNLVEKPINAWRKIIKNCKFDCWDCNFCDQVYEKKNGQQYNKLVSVVADELVKSVNYVNELKVPGLTSKRVQNLLFGIGQHVSKYLEIGSALGATAAAAGYNPNLEVNCVDNWQDDIQPQNSLFILPDNTKQSFTKNTSHIKNLRVFHTDLFKLDTTQIQGVELFFYDGPHDVETTKQAVIKVKDCLSDTAVLIFDDANWTDAVRGADEGIAACGFTKLYTKLVLNEIEDKDMWWNGLYIVVVQK